MPWHYYISPLDDLCTTGGNICYRKWSVECLRSFRRRGFVKKCSEDKYFLAISLKTFQCNLGLLYLILGWFPAKFVEILDERSKEVGIFLVSNLTVV